MAAGYLWALVPAVLILVGAGRRRCSIPSKTVGRIVPIARFVCRRRAGLEFHDPENSLVRASQSVLRIVCSDAALFLWRGWMGNGDQHRMRFRFIIGALLVVWALNSLATFCIIPSVPQHLYAVKILGQQVRSSGRHRSGQSSRSRSLERSGARLSRFELERTRRRRRSGEGS